MSTILPNPLQGEKLSEQTVATALPAGARVPILVPGAPAGQQNQTIAATLLSGVSQADLDAVAQTLPLRPARTANDALTAADIGALVPVTSSSAVTLTVAAGLGLPAPTGGNVGAVRVCYPVQRGTGVITVDGAPGVSVTAAPGGGLKSAGPGSRLILMWYDENTVVVEGGVQ